MVRYRREFIPKTDHPGNAWQPLESGAANLVKIDIHEHIAWEIRPDLFSSRIHRANENPGVIGIDISYAKLFPEQILLLKFALECVPVIHCEPLLFPLVRNEF
jgi:hypothetical protein